MALQAASIRSYFPPTPAASSNAAHPYSPPPSSTPATELGDGFTNEERRVKPRLATVETAWVPQQEYQDFDIADLVPGPGCRTFMGRVVNFDDQPYTSQRARTAKGCVKMIVKDDTGVISIRLWYAKDRPEIRLGQLVAVWTPHVLNGEHGNLTPWGVPLFTSIFPERDRGCHLMLHEASDDGTSCKTPLGYRPGRALSDLLTLQTFIEGGSGIAGAQILVVVKWIAAKKMVTTKKGNVQELVNVGLIDHTAEASLTLWGTMCTSVSAWKVAQTVLLITKPGCKIERKPSISLNSSTMVDVDPDIEDAVWLKGFASRLTRREHVNPELPAGVFDFESLAYAQLKIKYTLAELDEFARAGPSERFMGYMSVLVTELNLVLLQRRNMLMCNECCGIPIYANATSLKCKQCDTLVDLRINPRVLGPLLDETGTTTCGDIILSNKAWEQLFGRSARDLVRLSVDALRRIEQRLLFLRITLVFGWAAEEASGMGRMCIWRIQN